MKKKTITHKILSVSFQLCGTLNFDKNEKATYPKMKCEKKNF